MIFKLKKIKFALILCALAQPLMATAGWADEQKKSKERVLFNTKPTRAMVYVEDQQKKKIIGKCLTPCSIKMETSAVYRVAFVKIGYKNNVIDLPHYSDWSMVRKKQIKLHSYAEIAQAKYERYVQKCRIDDFTGLKDSSAKPCYRAPPIMPAKIKKSGSCKMVFDVDPAGTPINITAKCTARAIKQASIKTIKKWIYTPKIVNEKPVLQTGLQSTIEFRLDNGRGKRIP